MTTETDLAEAQAALDRLEQRTAEQRAYRNDALRAALANGTTWRRAQEITGLSPRGIKISIDPK